VNVRRPLGGIALVVLVLGLLAVGSVLVISDSTPLDGVFDGTPAEDERVGDVPPAHKDPDAYDETRDGAATSSWYSDRLSERLSESAESISEGEYDLARDVLGEEYLEEIERLAGVSDAETENETRVEEAFETSAEKQSNLSTLVESYESTLDDYENAIEDNESEQAEGLAQELEGLFEEIERTGEELNAAYAIIEDERGSDLSGPKANVEAIVEEIRQDQQAVRQSQLTETHLEVDADDQNVSLADPLPVTGHLEQANGSPIAEKAIQIEVEDQRYDLETDEDGAFTFEYRPTPVTTLETDTIDVAYVPGDNSTYLESNASLEVTLSQTPAELSDIHTSSPVRYGENVSVEGTLTMPGDFDGQVPLTFSVSETAIGEINASDNHFDGAETVPADIPAGEHDLVLAFDEHGEDRALSVDPYTVPIEITSTDTNLTVQADAVSEDLLSVSGSLETTDGTPVTDQPVELTIGEGDPVVTDTNATGEFSESVAVTAADLEGNETLHATFDGSGTNLESTSTAVDIPLSSASASSPFAGLSLPMVAGVLAVVVVITAFLSLRWWRDRETQEITEPPTPIMTEFTDTSTARDGVPRLADAVNIDPVDILESAEQSLENGDANIAVRLAYLAIRNHFATDSPEEITLTHWEFYAKHQGGPSEGDIRLRPIIETYEQAAFAPAGVSPRGANDVVDSARSFCLQNEPHTHTS